MRVSRCVLWISFLYYKANMVSIMSSKSTPLEGSSCTIPGSSSSTPTSSGAWCSSSNLVPCVPSPPPPQFQINNNPWLHLLSSHMSPKFCLLALTCVSNTYSHCLLVAWNVDNNIMSSYVYIRLVLVPTLAGKIQRTFFSIAVLPTVTIIFPWFTLVTSNWPNSFILPNLFCVIELHRITL
jgi:hypothetical protein